MEWSENAPENSSSGAGRMKKRYGERPHRGDPDNGDDELPLSPSSPAVPDLPDEVWALIFSKLPDGWYQSHRLATVSQQFARVAARWKFRVCETTSFDFRPGSRRRMKKRFMEMARKCGQHVKELVLVGQYFDSTSRSRISAKTVIDGLQFMPNLVVLDVSMCFMGRDMTILEALLQLEHLQDVRVTLAVRPRTFPHDYSFEFTDSTMNTLVSLAVKTSLQLTFVGWNPPGDDVKELLQRIRANAAHLRSLQVHNDFAVFATALCGVTPANVCGLSGNCVGCSSLEMNKFSPTSESFAFLQSLVLKYLHIEPDRLLEILKNNLQITQLSVGVTVDKVLSPDDMYNAEFFETFSRLENKFTLLDISGWRTSAPCDVLVKMAAAFKSLRHFAFLFRWHQVNRDWRDPQYSRDGNEHSAQLLVSACPNLSSLSIGGAIGVPGIEPTGSLWCASRHSRRIVLPENFGELATLGKLSRLRSLSLRAMSSWSDTDLESLASHRPHMECLQLSAINTEECTYIPRLAAAISKLQNLKTLALDTPNVEHQSFFESLEKLTQLENFSLRTEDTISDHTLIRFFESSQSPLNFVHIICVGPRTGLNELIQRLSELRPNSRLRIIHSLNQARQGSAHKGFERVRLGEPVFS